MSKAKRIIAMLLAVLMTVSMLTVVSLADSASNLFTAAYNDPTGTIKNNAVLVDPKVANLPIGSEYVAEWDDDYYTFIVGENVFATYAEAKAVISYNGQVLLGNGSFGEIDLDRPMQVFGINWNVNPNAVNPDDPTQAWTLNSRWNEKFTAVTNIVIRAGGIENVGVYGVIMQGRFYDIYRQVSSRKTTLTLQNIYLKQQASVLTSYYTSGAGRTTTNNVYTFMFWNFNSNNAEESAMYNKDETIIRNLRVEGGSLVSPCSRFVDEKVSPFITFDGMYMDVSVFDVSGPSSSVGWWMKWANYVADAAITITNSCFKGAKATFDFEGKNKAEASSYVADASLELNITNNLFYGITTTNLFNVYPECYSKLNFSGNYAVNTASAATTATVINWMKASSSTDYTDRIVMRDNTFLGYSGYSVNIGDENTKIDMTGTYISSTAYSASSWRNTTSTIAPTGKVRYDYYWFDAKRTDASNKISDFEITNAVLDKEAGTVTAEADVGAEAFVPTVTSADSAFKFRIYASDAEFSNIDTFMNETALSSCKLTNYTNYFLFVAMSVDGTRGDAYKMTVTKPVNEDIVVKGLIVAEPSDADDYTVTQNGLVYDLVIGREYSEAEFVLDTTNTLTAYDASGKVIDPVSLARYKLTGIKLQQPVTIKFVASNGVTSETYYVNVTRNLSNKTELISVDNAVIDGKNLTASVDGNATTFSFTPEVSLGATVYAWRGSTIAAPDANGTITVEGLNTGDNVYSIVVKAENGIDEAIYTLTVSKPMNSEAKLLGVEGAELVNGIYTLTARDEVKVKPVVSSGATYKLFYDPACTELAEETVYASEISCVYVVVTSEDGKNISNPIRIDIKQSDDGITVEGAEDEFGMFIVQIDKDVEEYKLNIAAKNATYKLYADMSLTQPASETVKLDQGVTYVYAVITYSDSTTELASIAIVSERTAVAYADADKIPSWAAEYIDAINESGLGILKGDDKGNFNATNNMTRYEIAAVAVRLLGVDASQYANVKLAYTDEIASWASNYVKAVASIGIMSGSNDANGKLVFNGAATTTRAQLAKIIVEVILNQTGLDITADEYYELCKEDIDEVYNEYAFADEASIQNWAKNYVKISVFLELFEGTESGGKYYFNPNNNIMRSEIATVVARYYGI